MAYKDIASYSSSAPEPTDAEKLEHKRYMERFENLRSARSQWETHWQRCMEVIVPRKEDVTNTQTPGNRRGDELFDTTAIMANQLLAAALHGMLTNPATRFFELIMGDAVLDEDEEVIGWLEEVGNRMFVIMNNSNFQTEIHEIYIDEGAIGTACLFMGEHPEKIVHFNARAIKEIYIDEDNLGLIDTVYRVFSWKPKQIVQEFGEKNLPDFVVKAYKEGCDDSWKILHAVHPQDISDPDAKGIFKFKSIYMLMEKPVFLSRSGFREFPYAVPRWTKTSGEIYGRGPGMEMLPDILMVNKMMETTLKGAQKTVDPPLMVADDGVIGRVRLTPGGLTVIRPMAGGDVPIKPLIVDARIDFGYQAVDDVRKRIQAGFYVDQLQLGQGGPQMTALEVSQRTQEKLRLMGPILGRQHFEFLRPVIERVFAIMGRRGLLPEAPAKIQGKKFDVRYSSLAAQAQRASDGANFSQAIAVASPIIQAKPEALDIIDADESVRYIFNIYGVPQRVMANDRKIQQVREGRAKANAQMVAQQQSDQQAQAAGKVLPGVAQLQTAQQR